MAGAESTCQGVSGHSYGQVQKTQIINGPVDHAKEFRLYPDKNGTIKGVQHKDSMSILSFGKISLASLCRLSRKELSRGRDWVRGHCSSHKKNLASFI